MDIVHVITLGVLGNVALVAGLASILSTKEHRHQSIVQDDLQLADAIAAFDPFNR